MQLKDLVKGLEILDVKGDLDIDITNVAYDSRKAKAGSLFVCIDGTKVDGHSFIPDALENGTRAFLVEKDVEVPEGVAVIKIRSARFALAYVSDAFYDHPSGKFNLVGVTGTKGKTTMSYMIKSILEAAGQKIGLIGTVEKLIGNEVLYAARTTPESHDLQSMFAEMVEKNVNSVVMEVSSQGLALHRVSQCDFDIGIFNNLSRDHIGPDEHASMEEYFNAKRKLFTMCKKGLVNIDSEYGCRVLEGATCETYTYGMSEKADIRAINIGKYPGYIEFKAVTPWGSADLRVNIQGEFNVYNALGAIGACCLSGIDFDAIREGLERVSVPGRMEVVSTGRDFTVIVDYAHTPDSLEKILGAVKEYAPGRVVCMFGCGGDRDRGKRPIMGEIAGRQADFTVITSDNPRTEDPGAIVTDIEEGIKTTAGKYITIVDRREAIRYSLLNAQPQDIIILAGKGHETYQQFKDTTIHFDEREVVGEILKELRVGVEN
jgi:UDP-N-acetylmuramoyl-L-alanyl-D-glutamate--2,6-diaminopimelate ligase